MYLSLTLLCTRARLRLYVLLRLLLPMLTLVQIWYTSMYSCMYHIQIPVLVRVLLPMLTLAQVRTGKYHGGFLSDGDLDEGHAGWTLGDFVSHEKSRLANLSRCETGPVLYPTAHTYTCSCHCDGTCACTHASKPYHLSTCTHTYT